MDALDNAREVLATTIRRSSVPKAVNRALVQRENKTRAQYLNQIYNKSRSSYTRARLSTLTGFEEPEHINMERENHTRNFSLPNISAITEKYLRTLKENILLKARRNVKQCRSTPVIEEDITKQNPKHSRTSLIAEIVLEYDEDDENTNGESDAKSKTVEAHASEQNIVASPSSSENVQEKNTHKTRTQFTDATMQNFLKDLRRKVPNAYVLDLLNHRLHEDSSENTAKQSNDSVSKQSGSDKITDFAGRCQTENYLGPLNKRVIMIAQGPKVSPHPRRRFCTKMQPTIKDTVVLKRNAAANVNFYCKGNVIGVFKFTLRLLPISECLKVGIESVHLLDEYKPGNEFMYVTGNTNRDGIVDKVRCLKTKAKPVLSSKQVHFNEEISVQDFDIFHFNTCSLTFRMFCYTEGISRTHRCVAEACVDLKDLRFAETDMRSVSLLCV